MYFFQKNVDKCKTHQVPIDPQEVFGVLFLVLVTGFPILANPPTSDYVQQKERPHKYLILPTSRLAVTHRGI